MQLHRLPHHRRRCHFRVISRLDWQYPEADVCLQVCQVSSNDVKTGLENRANIVILSIWQQKNILDLFFQPEIPANKKQSIADCFYFYFVIIFYFEELNRKYNLRSTRELTVRTDNRRGVKTTRQWTDNSINSP